MLTGKRAFSVVLVVASLAAAAVAALLTVEVEDPTVGDRDVLGRREVVRVASGSQDRTLTADVRPSSAGTTISADLARDLGLALEDGADTAEVQLTVGSTVREVEVRVGERDRLADDVELGRDVIGQALVDPTSVLLTELDRAEPSTVATLGDTLLGRDDPLGASALLALLPVGAMVIVVLRYLVGVSTLGTFAPVLVAVAFLQAGVLPALGIMTGIVGLGLALEPLLHRMRVPRVARLGVLIGLSSLVLVLLTQLVGAGGATARWGAAFPLVVAAGLVEQLWDVLEADGVRDAVGAAVGTLVVAAATIPVLLAEPVRRLGQSVPWLVVVVAIIGIVAAGSYRGLRLLELVRFKGAARRHGAPI